jgi:hypothetical protein
MLCAALITPRVTSGRRSRISGTRSGVLALATALLTLAGGCKSLLPKGAETTPLPWKSYAEAYEAVDAIEPYKSTRAALRAKGIDPAVNPSITILNYTDLLQRLTAVGAVTPGHLDRGIADCLDAGKRCTAYQIVVRQLQSKRVGNFWLDMLNFRRQTVTTGWSFSALIFFVDDTAVFALAGGQPNINSESMSHNPLGPLQGLGSSVPTPVP